MKHLPVLAFCGAVLHLSGGTVSAETLFDFQCSTAPAGSILPSLTSQGIDLKPGHPHGPTVASELPPEASGLKTAVSFSREDKDYLTSGTTVEVFNFKANQAFTVEGWFYLASLPDAKHQPHLICNRATPQQQNIGWAVLVTASEHAPDKANLKFFVDAGPIQEQGVVQAEAALEAKQWYHFSALRETDGTLRLYLNGVEVKGSGLVKIAGSLVTDSPTLIGKATMSEEKNVFFDGLIAELKVANEAVPGK